MANSRGGFSNRLGFILAAAGSAVGLGNIWKFPFEVRDGGGAAFVVMYLGFCFILCTPVMATEIAIGRHTSKDPVGAFRKLGHKKWSFIGIMGVIAGMLILSFYNVVAGWTLGFAIEMFQGNFEVGSNFGSFVADWKTTGAYATAFMLATAFIVSNGVSAGIEKASKILMPTLLVMVLGLMLYALSLPGSAEGLYYYLVPNFSAITMETVYGALGQAFFSLSLGMGTLLTYGSYISKKENIITSSAFITIADVGIAFIGGLMMFSFLGFVAHEQNSSIMDFKGGAGMIFMLLPGSFSSLGPVLGSIIGGVFFVLLSFAALTSTVSLLEVPVAFVVDEMKVERKKAVWGVAAIIFAIGMPSLMSAGGVEFFTEIHFMDWVENIASNTMLPLGGFLISIYGAYVWKKKNLYAEIAEGNPNFKYTLLAKYMEFALKYLCPVILGSITIVTIFDKFLGIDLLGLVIGQ
ncbi:sodium-dependent transporter [Algivirga pacifica]|uniref:Sodium-dependent transporter n=1 Tax=Algivirga pacifica TaxID=1162670 RepID=A0ABP9CX72_9BACT